jgi:nucleoside-diphosphate-sugar epimerase
MRILVTGGQGFVGTALVPRLVSESRWSVRASTRALSAGLPPEAEWIAGPDLGPDADWRPALAEVDVVVHLAARVHVQSSSARPSHEEFHRVNVDGTRVLAAQAVEAGVRRFVFLSSVKVHGEQGALHEDSALAPSDAYGISKRDAEAALRDLAQATGLEVVVVRPPLVHGPGVKANMRSLLAAVRRGIPLPLGAVSNRRSLVGVDNLADLIAACLEHPAAAGEAFLVSDGEDVSTPDLVRRLATAVNCGPRLLPVPVWCLRASAALLGRSAEVDRLTGSLTVDISKSRRLLGWVPPVTLDDGLRRMGHAP